MKTKSPLPYFGSDSEVAAQLASYLDHCKHVTIPFVGGAGIIQHLRARAIVANDKNGQVINFYRCLTGRYGVADKERLLELCSHTLSHPDELWVAERVQHSPNRALRAWAVWAQCWIGRKGQGGTKQQGSGMPSVRRTAGDGNNATRLRAAAADLEGWAQALERCEWQQLHFRELLPRVSDSVGCGIYCDPPWVGAGAAYLCRFIKEDHASLASMLERFAATTVVVRYGDHPSVRELYKGWQVVEAKSRDQTNTVKGEVWFIRNGRS